MTRILAALTALAVAVAALYWFQPWKLFTDATVTEQLTATQPEPSQSSEQAPQGPTVLARGDFVTHEHDTTGTATLVRDTDGSHRLELAGLATSDGPDLRVWLTDQPVLPGEDGWHVFDDGEYLEAGRLKGNRGDQVYRLDPGVDVSDYRSVTIWCERFSVSFGAATLRR
ncbi:hypothetical protein ACTI_85140 [Actinoplanes sp. OR16]|uniref:DM13 domain-containing protein n=1 Tax=Actinoplanes sp. OR16 TaxID=946334 RepID=UPI000F6EE42C|nr:DM13 domain-containing protein [Actinoplanes sp. OR16]BBH71829.1 hypothetical protein ACTI_85140 [Actinoplanes sp. OR16]